MVDVDDDRTAWDWQDPDAVSPRLEEFSERLATCQKLDAVTSSVPATRRGLAELGVTGVEFAAFRTAHATGLATDLAPLRAGDRLAERGPVYRVDDGGLFTRLDIGEPLPFGDASMAWVYAEHLIEHVTPPVAIRWLTEVRRILAPGGLLRITTPDLARYVRGYADGGPFFAEHRRRLARMRLGPPMPERPAFMLNQIFYLYGHRWIYDLPELRHVLAAAGFPPGAVTERGFRDGARADVATLDTAFRRDETIYLEATG